jgi:hypothetical protein
MVWLLLDATVMTTLSDCDSDCDSDCTSTNRYGR